MINLISGQKILLRQLKSTDAEFLMNNVTHREVRLQLRELPDPYFIEHAHEFISSSNADFESGKSFHFGIKLIESEELTGVIGNHFYDGESETAEIGYWIGKEYWGMGIATEAIKLFISFLASELKVKKIIANVFGNNTGSARALEKNGFINTGLSPEQYCNKINKSQIYKFELTIG